MELSRIFVTRPRNKDKKDGKLVSADINILGFETFSSIEGIEISQFFTRICKAAELNPEHMMIKYRREFNLEFSHLKNTKKK